MVFPFFSIKTKQKRVRLISCIKQVSPLFAKIKQNKEKPKKVVLLFQFWVFCIPRRYFIFLALNPSPSRVPGMASSSSAISFVSLFLLQFRPLPSSSFSISFVLLFLFQFRPLPLYFSLCLLQLVNQIIKE